MFGLMETFLYTHNNVIITMAKLTVPGCAVQKCYMDSYPPLALIYNHTFYIYFFTFVIHVPIIYTLLYVIYTYKLFYVNKIKRRRRKEKRKALFFFFGAWLVVTRTWRQQVLPASGPARWQRTRRFVWLDFDSTFSAYRKEMNSFPNQICALISAAS